MLAKVIEDNNKCFFLFRNVRYNKRKYHAEINQENLKVDIAIYIYYFVMLSYMHIKSYMQESEVIF